MKLIKESYKEDLLAEEQEHEVRKRLGVVLDRMAQLDVQRRIIKTLPQEVNDGMSDMGLIKALYYALDFDDSGTYDGSKTEVVKFANSIIDTLVAALDKCVDGLEKVWHFAQKTISRDYNTHNVYPYYQQYRSFRDAFVDFRDYGEELDRSKNK